ncbi:hypothetical protein [Vibrio sp. SCSIO 43136]|uniref:hypothetical protein n=1 Tax=Vibrio sp. SCSIO 43136 TaxID=2819101 RepID=UPI002074F8A1|nr:hypothetical protein [Vibrio sp. SCSIO 43136]USD64153.1 hypothetical protein J4N39_08485 [Vibrio sp. SCSIO 43136]
MKRVALALVLAGFSSFTFANSSQCLAQKYDGYIDASLNWYGELVEIAVEKQPELKEVGEWFLNGRKNHFELNRQAVHTFLVEDPSKVNTNVSVESWLQLEQHDVKALTGRTDELGKLAQVSFSDRQSKPHEKNYDLRTAFADLLSHPQHINDALTRYNEAVSQVAEIQCD